MDSGWFDDSSSQPAFGYTYVRRVIVFHHQSSSEDRDSYVREIMSAPVVNGIGANITGGTFGATEGPHGDVIWLEYTRDHTAVY
jgi:hypothetical protein